MSVSTRIPLQATDLAVRLGRLRLALEGARLTQVVPWEASAAVPGLAFSCLAGQAAPYPSSSPNRAEVLGDGYAVTAASIEKLLELCRERAADKLFFWLDPVPAANNIRELLSAAALSPFRGTSYPVLQRVAAPVPLPFTHFRIQRLSPGTGGALTGCYGDEFARREFGDYAGVPGWELFVAYEGDLVVASARLFVHDNLGYLCDGGTLETHRNRGAQSALIAARIHRAAELGCTHCCVQTLGLLKTSLANLERAGFCVSYLRQVWEWRPAG